jgi:hypothetical protein
MLSVVHLCVAALILTYVHQDTLHNNLELIQANRELILGNNLDNQEPTPASLELTEDTSNLEPTQDHLNNQEHTQDLLNIQELNLEHTLDSQEPNLEHTPDNRELNLEHTLDNQVLNLANLELTLDNNLDNQANQANQDNLDNLDNLVYNVIILLLFITSFIPLHKPLILHLYSLARYFIHASNITSYLTPSLCIPSTLHLVSIPTFLFINLFSRKASCGYSRPTRLPTPAQLPLG